MNVSMYTYCIAHSKNARRFGGEIRSQRERASNSDFLAGMSSSKEAEGSEPNLLFLQRDPRVCGGYVCSHNPVYISLFRLGDKQRKSRHAGQKIRLARQKNVQITPRSAGMFACNSLGPGPFPLHDCIQEVTMLLLRGTQ